MLPAKPLQGAVRAFIGISALGMTASVATARVSTTEDFSAIQNEDCCSFGTTCGETDDAKVLTLAANTELTATTSACTIE